MESGYSYFTGDTVSELQEKVSVEVVEGVSSFVSSFVSQNQTAPQRFLIDIVRASEHNFTSKR